MQLDFNKQRVWGPTPKYERVIAYNPYDKPFYVIAGPCSVEGENQIHEIARTVKECGANFLRGGVYRAGTYPGETFGLKDDLLKAFHDAAKINGIKNIVEVLDIRLIDRLLPYADCFQVGCRQMQHYALLRELGKIKKTVFLKRHPGSTLDEFLGAAEHLLVGGQCTPVLIERGTSSLHTHCRWDLSVSVIAAIKNITQMPIIVDASHGSGRADLVEPLTLAGVAAGADGFLNETHFSPYTSMSDKDQAITPHKFKAILKKVNKIRSAING